MYNRASQTKAISKNYSLNYVIHRYEITISNSCLLMGITSIIIPEVLRQKVLTAPHETHAGIVRMKSIARSYEWRPRINAAVEEMAKS